jgi:hypothetical protein
MTDLMLACARPFIAVVAVRSGVGSVSKVGMMLLGNCKSRPAGSRVQIRQERLVQEQRR